MGRLLKGLAVLLVEANCPLYKTNSPVHYRIPVAGRNVRLKCIVQVEEDQNRVIFFVTIRATVLPANRRDIESYVNSVNTQLDTSTLEFDVGAGWVGCRTGVVLDEMTLTTPQIATLLRSPLTCAVGTADTYGSGVVDIVNAGASAIYALEKIDAYTPQDIALQDIIMADRSVLD